MASYAHLQAMVSMLSGEVTKATVKTLEAASKALRFAKSNADVGLDYRKIGKKDEITLLPAGVTTRHRVVTWW